MDFLVDMLELLIVKELISSWILTSCQPYRSPRDKLVKDHPKNHKQVAIEEEGQTELRAKFTCN